MTHGILSWVTQTASSLRQACGLVAGDSTALNALVSFSLQTPNIIQPQTPIQPLLPLSSTEGSTHLAMVTCILMSPQGSEARLLGSGWITVT